MHESQLRRMQELTAQPANLALDRGIAHRIITPAAVGCITDYRMTDVRHVNANLMRASRLDLYFQQRELGVAFGGFKDRMRRAARAAAQHRHARAMVRAAAQPP